jgi:hypothetical protein
MGRPLDHRNSRVLPVVGLLVDSPDDPETGPRADCEGSSDNEEGDWAKQGGMKSGCSQKWSHRAAVLGCGSSGTYGERGSYQRRKQLRDVVPKSKRCSRPKRT